MFLSLGEDGESDEQVVLVSQSGTVNRIKVRDISIQSRRARGVILVRLDHAGKIQSASLISAADEEEGEGSQSLEESAASILFDFALAPRGMSYLHCCSPPTVHRYLKSSNLLEDRNLTVKIFGLSRGKHETYLTTSDC
ncbi:hypothetical protein Rs2_25214 [Raphanus sativus]|nr:hypothetical protein Rs2_25214 [Raphanus sativus]